MPVLLRQHYALPGNARDPGQKCRHLGVPMNPFFVGSWKERLLAELKSWIGTPYRHLGHYKGRGADCTLFIATAMLNIGIIGKLTYEHYHADWYVHAKDDFIAASYRENEKN